MNLLTACLHVYKESPVSGEMRFVFVNFGEIKFLNCYRIYLGLGFRLQPDIAYTTTRSFALYKDVELNTTCTCILPG